MSRKAMAIAIAAIAIAAAATCTAVVLSTPYHVTYDLNGGFSDNPSEYGHMDTLVLQPAEHPLYTFIGWSNEDGDIITEISGRDAMLSAVFESNYGKEITYSLSGRMDNRDIRGSATMTYIFTNDSNYLVRIDGTYAPIRSADSFTFREGHELTDSMDGFELEFDEHRVPTVMKKQDCNGSMVFEYVSERMVEIDDKVTVNVRSSDMGVKGAGSYRIGDTVTLEPEGDTRCILVHGWYENDKLFSKAQSLQFTAMFDLDYEMKASQFVDCATDISETYTLRSDVELTTGRWDIRDIDTYRSILPESLEGPRPTYRFESPGKYQISVYGTDTDGRMYTGSYSLLVDADVTRHFEWRYNDKEYSVDIDIPYHSYRSYKDDNSVRRVLDKSNAANNTVFSTYEDDSIIRLAEKMSAITSEMDDEDRANMVLALTQYIEYRYDKDSKKLDDRWNYALETLYEGYGDCEDTSILFCSIAYNMGYRVAEMVFPGHMAAGIVLDIESPSFEKDGVLYRFCETTIEDMRIGEVSSFMYTQENAQIFPVE